jgi:Tfp pilus assembly pilus retraction ATPase PilT
VNSIISQAVDDDASDIHFEPQAKELIVRFRHDGVLQEVMSIPRRMQSGVLSRLKIMADLDIAEKRIPQDGRVSANIAGKQVDLRVATLPTVYGEKVVMRVLDKGTSLLDLADLGFLPNTLQRYETMFHKPYGTILVTGPTGSGKSTTLYATLNQLNDPTKNIITVEDPVEYRLPGINQVQINNKAGLTFAAALRTILRKAERDEITVQFDMRRMDQFQRRLERISNRLSFGLIMLSVSIIIAGVLVGSGLGANAGGEMPALADIVLKAGLALILIMLLGLVISMIRTRR